MKKIFSLILALTMVVLCFGACGSQKDAATEAVKDSDYVKANGKLIIGITDYEPMNYKDDNGNWTGFDTEFALAVCEKLGVEAEFVEIDWDNKFPALESKSIDCIWNGMTISEEVLQNTNCSAPYVKNAQVVVLSKEKAEQYKDAESMKNLVFAAEASSAGAAAAVENGFESLLEVGTQTDALLEVTSGSSDACIIDLTMAKAMLGEDTNYSDLTIACELTSEEYGIGFRKGSDLTEIVNGYMDELIADGTLPELAEKYGLVLSADA